MKRRRQSLRTKLANAQRKNGELQRRVFQLENWVEDVFRVSVGTAILTKAGLSADMIVAIRTARLLDHVVIVTPDSFEDGKYQFRAKSRPRV